jgi:hypothetical protein
MSKNITTEDFIKMSIELFTDKYNYSKTNYVKMKDKVIIICNVHKIEFLQTPDKHLSSKTGGCPKCNTIGKGRLTNKLFIEKSNLIHLNKYDYSITEYIKSNEKVKISCKKHGPFEINANSHLNGRGCSKCGGNYKYKIIELLDTFNNMYRGYTYDFSNYKNIKSRILVKCPKHSQFETSTELLLNGYGCSSCGKKSTGEEKVSEVLNKNNIIYIKQKSFDGCVFKNKMQFDFFIPEFNTCIEYDGIQHFEPIKYFGGIYSLEKQKIKDSIKDNFCKKNNIKLIRIPYYEFDNIEKILNYSL